MGRFKIILIALAVTGFSVLTIAQGGGPAGIPDNYRGQMVLQSDTTFTFAQANTYQKILGDFGDGQVNEWEVDNANNRIYYRGPSGEIHLGLGQSEVEISNASEITFGLYLNGTLVPGGETPHTFTSTAKISSIAISRIVEVNHDDYFEVFAKCTGTYDLTVVTLSFIFWGN